MNWNEHKARLYFFQIACGSNDDMLSIGKGDSEGVVYDNLVNLSQYDMITLYMDGIGYGTCQGRYQRLFREEDIPSIPNYIYNRFNIKDTRTEVVCMQNGITKLTVTKGRVVKLS